MAKSTKQDKKTKPVPRKYNQLKALLAITKASMISTLRSPSSLIFGLIFPIIFVSIFGLLDDQGLSFDVALRKGSDTTNPIFESLSESESVTFEYDLSDTEILEKLEKGKLDAEIFIERRDYQLPMYEITVTVSNASQMSGQFLHVVSGISDKINLAAAPVDGFLTSLSVSEVEGRKYKAIDFILPGQLGFSLLNMGVFATAFVFLRLRETLVLKRFFATPVKKLYVIVGEAFSRLSISLLQAMLVILLGYFFLGFTLSNGVETFISMVLLSAIGLIIFMGFGFMISGIAKTDAAISPFANIITLPQMLLSGTFFEMEFFPTWLQSIGKALPLTYFNDAMRKIAFEGLSLVDVWPELLALSVWGIGIYFVAIRVFKWEAD
ncbi:ABC transporter permease [Candidatus Dojkabacteria bacterium]|nr:ABC transporter permease [Candidatus Dojkabacteria bacterium]